MLCQVIVLPPLFSHVTKNLTNAQVKSQATSSCGNLVCGISLFVGVRVCVLGRVGVLLSVRTCKQNG